MTNFVLFTDEFNDERNKQNAEGESLTEVSKKSSKSSLFGNVAMNVTVASMKFKSKKGTNASKRKISKDSFKAKSKASRRSFLEENIKSAGNSELHIKKKSIIPTEEELENNPNVSKEPEETVSAKAQSNIIELDAKHHSKNTLTLLYAKEKKDLEQAHSVLLEEYHRKRQIKTKIMEKFGRASKNLKLELAISRGWKEKVKESGPRKEASRKDISEKCSNDSKISETKTKRFSRFDDADRI